MVMKGVGPSPTSHGVHAAEPVEEVWSPAITAINVGVTVGSSAGRKLVVPEHKLETARRLV